jgi:hypothetical protein
MFATKTQAPGIVPPGACVFLNRSDNRSASANTHTWRRRFGRMLTQERRAPPATVILVDDAING